MIKLTNIKLTCKPKLAFFDIDGTLIGSSGILSLRTKEALFALRDKGVLLALATGRPLFGAQAIADQLEIDCFSLFSSGALLANPKNNSTLFEATIEIPLLKKCIDLAKELELYIELYTRDNYFIEKTTAMTAKHTSYLGFGPSVSDFEEVLKSSSINKIVTISDSEELDTRQKTLIAAMNNLVSLCSKGASHPEILFNNITSPAANRSDGFKRLTEALGVCAEEVIAFGDTSSDLIFLELSGLGVAMKGAPEEVQRKANLVTDTAENDGVAQVVEMIVEQMDSF